MMSDFMDEDPEMARIRDYDFPYLVNVPAGYPWPREPKRRNWFARLWRRLWVWSYSIRGKRVPTVPVPAQSQAEVDALIREVETQVRELDRQEVHSSLVAFLIGRDRENREFFSGDPKDNTRWYRLKCWIRRRLGIPTAKETRFHWTAEEAAVLRKKEIETREPLEFLWQPEVIPSPPYTLAPVPANELATLFPEWAPEIMRTCILQQSYVESIPAETRYLELNLPKPRAYALHGGDGKTVPLIGAIECLTCNFVCANPIHAREKYCCHCRMYLDDDIPGRQREIREAVDNCESQITSQPIFTMLDYDMRLKGFRTLLDWWAARGYYQKLDPDLRMTLPDSDSIVGRWFNEPLKPMRFEYWGDRPPASFRQEVEGRWPEHVDRIVVAVPGAAGDIAVEELTSITRAVGLIVGCLSGLAAAGESRTVLIGYRREDHGRKLERELNEAAPGIMTRRFNIHGDAYLSWNADACVYIDAESAKDERHLDRFLHRCRRRPQPWPITGIFTVPPSHPGLF